MYKVEPNGEIVRIDGMTIPKDITNPAYTQYLHWMQHNEYVGPPIFFPEIPVNEED